LEYAVVKRLEKPATDRVAAISQLKNEKRWHGEVLRF
jgi:hypothetical protein